MPGAVGAIGGVRRGVARGKDEARIKERERYAKARLEATARYEEDKKTVTNIMNAYDKNKTDHLEPDQVMDMLHDYSLKLKGHTEKPTEDEVGCLIALCDKAGDGRISKKELMGALVTWFAYIEKGNETLALLEKHDLSKTGKINHGELEPLLTELNDGETVPDDVAKWVWEQADLNGTGSLNQFELTRAIAAWYVWLPEEQPGGPPGPIVGNLDTDAMPKQKPPPPQSACCAVQ